MFYLRHWCPWGLQPEVRACQKPVGSVSCNCTRPQHLHTPDWLLLRSDLVIKHTVSYWINRPQFNATGDMNAARAAGAVLLQRTPDGVAVVVDSQQVLMIPDTLVQRSLCLDTSCRASSVGEQVPLSLDVSLLQAWHKFSSCWPCRMEIQELCDVVKVRPRRIIEPSVRLTLLHCN